MNPTARGISPVLDGYLAELDAATAHLPADEAYEIRTGIEQHITDRLTDPHHVSDDDARRIVRDLGPVSMIVNAADTSETPSTHPASTQALSYHSAPTQEIPATAPYSNSAPQPAPPKRPASYARIACILAIVTAASMFFFWPLSLVVGLCALGFGIAGLRAGEPRAESWTGIGVGLLPIVLAAIYAVFGMSISTSTSVENGAGPGSSTHPTMVHTTTP